MNSRKANVSLLEAQKGNAQSRLFVNVGDVVQLLDTGTQTSPGKTCPASRRTFNHQETGHNLMLPILYNNAYGVAIRVATHTDKRPPSEIHVLLL